MDNNNDDDGPSIVDRSIDPILVPKNKRFLSKRKSSPPSITTTYHPPQTERWHRLYGTSLIQSASILLQFGTSSYATATTIFHRFYHKNSLYMWDVWSIALACTILAGKLEEDPKRMRDVIFVYVYLYRKRRLCIGLTKEDEDEEDCTLIHQKQQQQHKQNNNTQDEEEGVCNKFKKSKRPRPIIVQSPLLDTTEKLSSFEEEEKRKVAILNKSKPLNVFGPAYAEWVEALRKAENVVLRELGFTLHWISDSHPHKFILYFVRVLEMEDKQLVQRAWNYCNDSCRLDLCIRYEPELVACASIHMSSIDQSQCLPMEPHPWWEVFVGPNRDLDLSTICNAIVSLYDERYREEHSLIAKAFLPSLIDGGSFNDPESYLWSVSD